MLKPSLIPWEKEKDGFRCRVLISGLPLLLAHTDGYLIWEEGADIEFLYG